MHRVAAILGAALLFGAAIAGEPAQVALTAEPRHGLRLYAAHLRIFDINIPPGDTTLDHEHRYDMASVAIGTAATRSRASGEDWGPARPRALGSLRITAYTGMPAVHRIENGDTTASRLIAVENVRDGGWLTPPPVSAPGTSLIEQSRAFTVYDVRLTAATPRTTHTHEVPAVAVLVTGAFENQGGGGETPFRLREPGRWLLTPMGQGHTMSVAGSDAHIVEIEAR